MLKDTSSFWRSTPKGRKTTALTSEKMVVLAPMPRASVTIAAAVNPGLERSRRKRKGQIVAQHELLMGTLVAAKKLRILNQITASTARFWDEPAHVRSLAEVTSEGAQ